MEDLWGWSAQSTAGEAAERAELLGSSRHKREWARSKFPQRTGSKGQSAVDSPTFPGIVERSLGLQGVSDSMHREYSAFYSWGEVQGMNVWRKTQVT